MKLVTYELAIDAPPEVVFGLFTTVDGLRRWIAADAVVEPVPGGILRWTHENGATMAGRFVELDPPRRLVFSYGWEGDLMAPAGGQHRRDRARGARRRNALPIVPPRGPAGRGRGPSARMDRLPRAPPRRGGSGSSGNHPVATPSIGDAR